MEQQKEKELSFHRQDIEKNTGMLLFIICNMKMTFLKNVYPQEKRWRMLPVSAICL